VLKRAFDATLAGAGLLASSPLWAIFAAAIRIEDGGPVFFRQDRVGLGGRTFEALKFRSMRPDAEAMTGAMQATENDPRVTRIGRFMRATAMDELPQLWNILRGDMSFVGPRPIRPRFFEQLAGELPAWNILRGEMSFVGPRALRPGEIEAGANGRLTRLEEVPGFEHRIKVRPGLTGLAQVYAPRDVPRRQKFRYDRLYVDRRSWKLDLQLLLLSFWISLHGTWEARGRKY